MRKTFIVCTVAIAVFAASVIASPRAEAITIGSSAGLSAAIHEANLAQDVAYYYPYAVLLALWIFPVCLSWLVEGVRVGAWSLRELVAE